MPLGKALAATILPAALAVVTECARLTTVRPLELEGMEAFGISTPRARPPMQSRLLRQSYKKCDVFFKPGVRSSCRATGPWRSGPD